MSDFLTAVSTKKVSQSEPQDQKRTSVGAQNVTRSIDTASAALEALKNQPERETLDSVLKYLTSGSDSLITPDPVNASITYILISSTIPSYWTLLKESPQAKLVEKILRNPTGLGHIITRLRALISDSQQKKTVGETHNSSGHIRDLLDVLEGVLRDDSTSSSILKDSLTHGNNANQQKLIWKEYLGQIASGRVVSIVAEAEDVLKKSPDFAKTSWLSDGNVFASWLGRNIAVLLKDDNKGEGRVTATVELCSKALNLGYTDRIMGSLLAILIDADSLELLSEAISSLKSFEQRKYLDAIISYTSKQYFSSELVTKDQQPISPSKAVSSVANLVHLIIKDKETLKEHIIALLTRSTIPSLNDSLDARRSVLAALAQDEDKLHTLLENCIKLFGDSVYVKHTPVMQQEALAQNLAMCCGYVHRTQPMFLTMMAKSSFQLNGMSTRINASSPRTRFLGIAVGVAMSRMVDKPDLQLKFELDGDEAVEAKWYQQLTNVHDAIGSLSDLKQPLRAIIGSKIVERKNKPAVKPLKASQTEIQGPRVIEVLSDSEDEDEDLIAYEKPDSDREDEDDDPTVVNRNKPNTPVYIRDLIFGLRDQENYDRHALALSTAASLIRRKANFGTEVIDHLEELATILTGLQDNLELEDFAQQRQQALIAVLLAKPAQVAQWFAQSFFTGDYSYTQRTVILTTLGLGARELAGIKDDSTEDLLPPTPSFPSKQLPPNLHKIYAENKTQDPVARISSKMAREMLSPMASQAADQLSGPNILKVRTFSSRMEVEKKRKKPIPNALAQIVADNFFFPLTGRWWLQVRASTSSIYTSKHLLPSFLQTLSLLLNASGPNTLALPQMTREYWDLLLSIRGLAANDKQILNALLFGFLMLLETNENKERLATEQGKELMETLEWVRLVFRELGAGSEEDERIRVLAAGVVVRCQEVVEKYQRRMAGVLMDY